MTNIISFEGFEFSGKSTQIGLLKKYLSRKNVKVKFTREPGGSNNLEKIRVLFNEVKVQYEYSKPETDKKNKLTKLKSHSTIEIPDDLFNQIVDKIIEVRNIIIK